MFYGEDVPKTNHLKYLIDKGLPALDFLETYGVNPNFQAASGERQGLYKVGPYQI